MHSAGPTSRHVLPSVEHDRRATSPLTRLLWFLFMKWTQVDARSSLIHLLGSMNRIKSEFLRRLSWGSRRSWDHVEDILPAYMCVNESCIWRWASELVCCDACCGYDMIECSDCLWVDVGPAILSLRLRLPGEWPVRPVSAVCRRLARAQLCR